MDFVKKGGDAGKKEPCSGSKENRKEKGKSALFSQRRRTSGVAKRVTDSWGENEGKKPEIGNRGAGDQESGEIIVRPKRGTSSHKAKTAFRNKEEGREKIKPRRGQRVPRGDRNYSRHSQTAATSDVSKKRTEKFQGGTEPGLTIPGNSRAQQSDRIETRKETTLLSRRIADQGQCSTCSRVSLWNWPV